MNNFKKLIKRNIIEIFTNQTKRIFAITAFMVTLVCISFAMNDMYTTIKENKETETVETSIEETTEKIVEEITTEEVEAEEETAVKQKFYTTIANDSYYKISEEYYGDGKYCYALAEYNKANGNYTLPVGKVLYIPEITNEEFLKLYKDINKKTIEQEKKIKEEKKENNNTPTSNTTSNQTSKSTSQEIVKTSSGVRNNPGEVDTSNYTYLGKKKITGYTPGCVHCCGSSNGITASGTKALPGRTIAAKGLKFGDTVYIKGYGYYTVEDRGGFSSNTIDMAAASHDECYSITSSGVDCYLVP